ncbi:hypothetical protein D8674_019547 [Pyrus ussuriensis x Pyrus communis]|uniref:Uncharacterized protein n=1 Tax=Pyrus ussuriensis x Pyrus communis TaxID=2448454 RepID=A0A5N5G7W9_9ROSA|nr:hypothetical protein D8674_019547 [Pyrus ussuriensis x Pyrus communis]
MMYIGGLDKEEKVEVKSMAMGSERWGNQKHLWCLKESSDASESGGESLGLIGDCWLRRLRARRR